MTIKSIAFLSIGLFLTTATVFADQNCSVMGSSRGNTYMGLTNCSGATITALTVNGPLRAKDSKFTSNVTVNGPIMMKGSQINGNTTINGPIFVQTSKINGEVTISGPIYAKDTSFGKKLTISSNIAAFKHCLTEAIVMKKSEGLQRVYIMDNTIVSGDITFEKSGGVVVLSKNSQITGKVIGGTIKQSDEEPKLFDKAHTQ